MNRGIWRWNIPLFALSAAFPLLSAPETDARQHPIDTAKSTMTIRVYKAGVLSAFGHDHEIAAPIAGGSIDIVNPQAELRVDARALRVRDAKASDKDRSQIEHTMLGPDVLDSGQYPEIVFRSTAVESSGAGSWKVHGALTLHGQSHPVTVEVSEKDGHYLGNSLLKQTDFGIQPVRVGGGTVRVKDEVRIEFDILLVR